MHTEPVCDMDIYSLLCAKCISETFALLPNFFNACVQLVKLPRHHMQILLNVNLFCMTVGRLFRF